VDNYEKRRQRFNDLERHKIEGKVSRRIEMRIARCYMYGDLRKPLESITDVEFLSVFDIGPKTLADIRKIIPAPA